MYTFDEIIKKYEKDLKEIIIEFKKEINKNNFDIIYDKLWERYGPDNERTPAFTALLLNNNINPLKYMGWCMPDNFATNLCIKKFVIPDNITEIGYSAFKNCRNLADITLGSETDLIQSDAFKGCVSLNRIELPESVAFINERAFRNCYNLKDVYYEGSWQQWYDVKIEPNNDELLNATIYHAS